MFCTSEELVERIDLWGQIDAGYGSMGSWERSDWLPMLPSG